jgi:hypothetical protein
MNLISTQSKTSRGQSLRDKKHGKYLMRLRMAHWSLLLAPLLASSANAQAFSGEGPVFGHLQYHEKTTGLAAKEAGFRINAVKGAGQLAAPIAGTGSGFRTLGEWGVRIESTRVARKNQVEVVAVFKNLLRKERLLDASIPDMVLTDSDGVGIRNIGNLYKPDGDPEMEPEKIVGSVPVAPGATTRILSLFIIPAGETPLKTLTVFGPLVKPLTFNVSGLMLPEQVAAVSVPPRGAAGGTAEFTDFGVYGLRFDGARKGRNGSLQIFLTAKSMEKTAWRSHPTYSLDVAVVDADGATIKANGNLYRASGEGLEMQRIQHGVFIVPGGETMLCYVVKLPTGAKARQLVAKYEGKTLLANLPELP